MGAKVLRMLGHYKDEIDIVTTKIEEEADGIQKTSVIDTTAHDTEPRRDLWIGLKIDKRQKVISLSVDSKIWVEPNSSQDAAAKTQFDTLMPPGAGEKWAAYKVAPGNRPHTFKFESKLKLDRHVASDPDAQAVAVAICYVPKGGAPLERKSILLGHSLVQSPRPDMKAARKSS